MERHYITGDIDNEAFKRLYRFVVRCEKDGLSEVILILSSYGGDAYAAMAMRDLIYRSNLDFYIHGYGLIASAATLILAAGTTGKRTMSEHAWVMVHEDSLHKAEVGGKMVSEVEKVAKHYRVLENQWNQLMEKETGTRAATWALMNRQETYLTAEQCLHYGLIDEVVK